MAAVNAAAEEQKKIGVVSDDRRGKYTNDIGNQIRQLCSTLGVLARKGNGKLRHVERCTILVAARVGGLTESDDEQSGRQRNSGRRSIEPLA